MENSVNKPDSRENLQIREWFDRMEWLQGWNVKPHPSVNTGLLAEQYVKAPEIWKRMFSILKSGEFRDLAPGKHEVDGDNLFFMINQYETRDAETVRFEAHRKYIDLQYVFEGQELMGVSSAEYATETVPYSSDNDIVFYEVSKAEHFKATPSEFLLFFPVELHQPGVRVTEPVPVKKVVFKIKWL